MATASLLLHVLCFLLSGCAVLGEQRGGGATTDLNCLSVWKSSICLVKFYWGDFVVC